MAGASRTRPACFAPPCARGHGQRPVRIGSKLLVGIADLVVSDSPDDSIIAHALGSCVAVSVWDPALQVGGLLHFLLPESRISPERAAEQPAAFADSGIPLLFQALFRLGLHKKRALVKLAGGADIANALGDPVFNIGRRNALAARQILWRNGVLVSAEALGGTVARTVCLRLGDGVLTVSVGGVEREM